MSIATGVHGMTASRANLRPAVSTRTVSPAQSVPHHIVLSRLQTLPSMLRTMHSKRNARMSAKSAEQGYTLVEMLIVVLLLAVLAGAAVMASEPLRAMALSAAASEIMQAMDFARSEAVRAGSPRLVEIDVNNKVIRVHQLKYSTSTPVVDTANPILHPLDKTAYSATLSGLTFLPISMSVSAGFKYSNGQTLPTLAFTRDGAPCTVVGPDANTVSALSAASMPQITLLSGNVSRGITVEPVSGRVTMQ